MSARAILAALLLASLAAPTAPRAASAADLSKVFDAALNVDMVSALAVLDSLDTKQLSHKDKDTADCIRKTFRAAAQSTGADHSQPENLPPRVHEIRRAYREYWHGMMLRQASAPEAEALLLAALNRALAGAPAAAGAGATDSPAADTTAGLDVVTERARTAIEAGGLHALAGVTSPLWEMMIWKTQTPRTYRVKLTDRSVEVRVVFIDDFVSLGWAGYATCGRAHTGGWATKEELYALRSSYDLNSENFRVSYLAHEGRHFADYKRFPKLEQPELEYRAKLTEIAVSEKTTHELIENFARRNGRDRAVPHSFANYCVARDLGRAVLGAGAADDPSAWAKISAARLRSEAAKLLRENGARLDRSGPAEIARFLDADGG